MHHSHSQPAKEGGQTKVPTYDCPLCTEVVDTSENNLAKHLKDTHGKKCPYVCEKCPTEAGGRIFKKLSIFLTHQAICHTPAICEVCGLNLPSIKQLRMHKIKHGMKRYHCQWENCDFAAYFKSQVNYHVRQSHGDGNDRVCDQCGEICRNEILLQMHIQRHHKAMSNVHCKECDIFTDSKESYLAHHREVHGKKNALQCEICNVPFETPQYLAGHISRKHKGESQAVYGCQQPFCSLGFTSLLLYKEHVALDHGDDITFKCPVDECHFIEEVAAKFVTHLWRVHRTIFVYKCSNCSFQSKSQEDFVDHCMADHSNLSPFKCYFCPKQFTEEADLLHHHKEAHSDNIYKCCHLDCGEIFASSENIRFHMQAMHLTHDGLGFSIRCDTCHLAFSDQEACNYHTSSKLCQAWPRKVQTVSSTRPKCSFCLKTFNHFVNLRQHQLETHLDLAKFHCSHCEEPFFSNRALVNHNGTMNNLCTKEKWEERERLRKIPKKPKRPTVYKPDKRKGPFCPYCPEEFATSNQLKRHKVKEHKEHADLNCPVCQDIFFSKGALRQHQSSRKACSKREIDRVGNPSRDQVTCKMCGESFKYYRDLKVHKLARHGVETMKCDHCDRVFLNKSALNLHRRKSKTCNVPQNDPADMDYFADNPDPIEEEEEVILRKED